MICFTALSPPVSYALKLLFELSSDFDSTKLIWLVGVRFPGLTHPGIVGTAPSMELLQIWNEREKKLVETDIGSLKLSEVVHQRPLANLPNTRNCLLGKV